MGIEPILSAWKAEVLAIIRMTHNSARGQMSAINKMVTVNIAVRAECRGGAGIRTQNQLVSPDKDLESPVLPLDYAPIKERTDKAQSKPQSLKIENMVKNIIE